MNHSRVLALLLIALNSAAPARAEASCRIPAGRVIATDRVAELIAIPTPTGRALYACIRRSGRKVALDYGFTDARLTGPWVAWQRPHTGAPWRIAVHDLRGGRERLVIGHVAQHSLGLTARGSIVWAQLQSRTTTTPLYANDTLHGGRLLDAGSVDARSVKLTGRRVSWRSGGASHSALLL